MEPFNDYGPPRYAKRNLPRKRLESLGDAAGSLEHFLGWAEICAVEFLVGCEGPNSKQRNQPSVDTFGMIFLETR